MNFPGIRQFVLCILFLLPVFSSAQIIVNEVAWMGSLLDGVANANAEWIELFNTGSGSIDLSGWALVSEDGTPSINLSGTIGAGGYFLLERTSDDSVPNIPADLIYTGALGNAGEVLVVTNASSIEEYRLGAVPWPSGDNTTKQTMQWNGSSWITATSTPRATNIVPVPDTTPPVVVLIGDDPQNVFSRNSYIDAGATATDDIDGDISSSIIINSGVVNGEPGSYLVTYNVSDSSGNAAAEVVRRVNIVQSSGSSSRGSLSVSVPSGEVLGVAVTALPSDEVKEISQGLSSVERQAEIGRVRAELVSKINELIALLQSQLSALTILEA